MTKKRSCPPVTIHLRVEGDSPLNPPYSQVQREAILSAFGQPKTSGDWIVEIEKAAFEFLMIQAQYNKRKTAKRIRDEAASAARTLDEAMGLMSALDLERGEVCRRSYGADELNFTSKILATLRDEFRAVEKKWEGRKIPKNPPRIYFVSCLFQIWKRAHGSIPGRRNSTDTQARFETGGQPYGPFYGFATACLKPIGSTDGLDDIIRDILWELNR